MPQYDPDIHHRRSIRLKDYDYSQQGAYFVTICTHQRQCLFGEIIDGKVILNDVGRIVEQEWLQTPVVRPYVEIDAYVVMPNHFHGILFILNDTPSVPTNPSFPNAVRPKSLGDTLGGFKSTVTRKVNKSQETLGALLWQRSFYESVLWNERSLNARRQYIQLNPERWMGDEHNPQNIRFGG